MGGIQGGVDERRQRWRRFYDMNSDCRRVFLVRYQEGMPEMPPLNPDKKHERIDWAWTKYQRWVEQLDWLDDDFLPYLEVVTGTEIFAEAFGCRVHRSNDLPFALPMIRRASEVARLQVPDIGATPLTMYFEMADELRRRAGNGALLKIVDIQSPMDIAALIWDKNDFYAAMIEAPEAVKELAGKVTQLLTAFLDEWFRRYGKEFVAHFPDYYMPEGITLSEDEVGAVSAQDFQTYFLPELAQLSDRYGGIGVHCCANARHQWPNFKQIPNLRMLNLVQPEPEIADACRFFAAHVCQMHGLTRPDQAPPNAHIVLEIAAESRQQAIQAATELRGSGSSG